MTDFVILCGVTLCALVSIILLKRSKTGIALPLASVVGVLLLKAAFNMAHVYKGTIAELLSAVNEKETLTILSKVFFVALLAETTADICRESGEDHLAKSIETVGKIEILILCLPVIESVLEIVKEIML